MDGSVLADHKNVNTVMSNYGLSGKEEIDKYLSCILHITIYMSRSSTEFIWKLVPQHSGYTTKDDSHWHNKWNPVNVYYLAFCQSASPGPHLLTWFNFNPGMDK